MRSLGHLVALLPVLALSFGVVACGDEAEVPPPVVEQQRQEQNEALPAPAPADRGAEGATCTSDSACQAGLVCSLRGATTVKTLGLPADTGDDDDDNNNDFVPPPAPVEKTNDSAKLAGHCATRR